MVEHLDSRLLSVENFPHPLREATKQIAIGDATFENDTVALSTARELVSALVVTALALLHDSQLPDAQPASPTSQSKPCPPAIGAGVDML